MKWRRAVALMALAATALIPGVAAAQVRVRLSGQADSTAGIDVQRVGNKKVETITWGSRYLPTLDGFVMSPRLLTFSLSGTYADQNTLVDQGGSDFHQLEPYRLSLHAFPQASNSFTLSAVRTMTDTTFTDTTALLSTTTTADREALSWTYRGNAVLPRVTADFTRQTTHVEAAGGSSEDARNTFTVRAQKALGRFNPNVAYSLEMLETQERSGTVAALEPSVVERTGINQRFAYDDRIQVGQRSFLTPVLAYQRGPEQQSLESGVRLTTPLSPTVDVASGMRYALSQAQDSAVLQTTAADSTVTMRLSPTLTVTGGANGALVESDGLSWNGGVLGGVSATPLNDLRIGGDVATQTTGGATPGSIGYRAHLGASTGYLPRHTVAADYFVNIVEPDGQPVFLGQSGAFTVTSLVIPLTILTAGYHLDLQDGAGSRRAQEARLDATFSPPSRFVVRAGLEAGTAATRGGGRTPTDDTSYAASAGVDVSALSWLTLSATGRRGVRDVRLEDKRGEFVSESLRGAATVRNGRLQARTEVFLEREPVVNLSRQGVRGEIGYTFRVWTVTVDYERSSATSALVDTERTRAFVRISRPIDSMFSWPFGWPFAWP